MRLTSSLGIGFESKSFDEPESNPARERYKQCGGEVAVKLKRCRSRVGARKLNLMWCVLCL